MALGTTKLARYKGLLIFGSRIIYLIFLTSIGAFEWGECIWWQIWISTHWNHASFVSQLLPGLHPFNKYTQLVRSRRNIPFQLDGIILFWHRWRGVALQYKQEGVERNTQARRNYHSHRVRAWGWEPQTSRKCHSCIACHRHSPPTTSYLAQVGYKLGSSQNAVNIFLSEKATKPLKSDWKGWKRGQESDSVGQSKHCCWKIMNHEYLKEPFEKTWETKNRGFMEV